MDKAVFDISRRDLLGGAMKGGGLLLGMKLGLSSAAVAAQKGAAAPLFDSWLRIGNDGAVSVLVNIIEMGQGAQTGFAQIVADELDVEWSKVSVEQAPVERSYFNVFGIYSTGGSVAIRTNFDKLRRAGAAARSMLTAAAAARWGVPDGECLARNGRVFHAASGKSLSYGELAEEAAALPVPEKPPLKERSEWRYIGKPMERLGLKPIVDGTNIYGVDVRMPGLLVATILQCPVFGGRLVGVDPAPALAVRGVKRVLELNGGRIKSVEERGTQGALVEQTDPLTDAVVVVADGYWPATKGLRALRPRWDFGALGKTSSADISKGLRLAVAEAAEASLGREVNEVELRRQVHERLAKATRRVEASYEVPLLSQSPLEPMNGTAWVKEDSAEVWLSTQVQSPVREAIARAIGMPVEKVTVHTTQVGGSFGRRLATDYGVQAALISKAIGAPVKLIWSRQEDTKHGFYRAAAAAQMEAALDADGKPEGVRMRLASMEPYSSGGDMTMHPYDLGPAIGMEKRWNPGIPIGSWRAISHTYNTFFLESFIDELAAAASADPIDYRRSLLTKQPRMVRTLDAAADAAGWRTAPAAGRHRGVALSGGLWRTYCAQIVELSVSPLKEITIHKITCALDAGTIVNPDQVRAQIEGGIIYGLSAALFQEITIANGQVEQSTFRDYPIIKMANSPNIEIVLLESPGERLGGVGEAPVPPIAPALCNALFAATGTRVRQLPLTKANFRSA
ncbi:MAG TPA: molybdopterin cofactor-binding domain-containing protein [Allosphingosinicella sp.]|uniref:xanthine dehydrogenase family protein molybdopterin-binding subunit n=1 Tax=Allosphingosinicella sp. TaxID=2823234 RepID=UPI002ED7BBBB